MTADFGQFLNVMFFDYEDIWVLTMLCLCCYMIMTIFVDTHKQLYRITAYFALVTTVIWVVTFGYLKWLDPQGELHAQYTAKFTPVELSVLADCHDTDGCKLKTYKNTITGAITRQSAPTNPNDFFPDLQHIMRLEDINAKFTLKSFYTRYSEQPVQTQQRYMISERFVEMNKKCLTPANVGLYDEVSEVEYNKVMNHVMTCEQR